MATSRDGAREAGVGSALAGMASDASMGDALSEEAWDVVEAGEAEDRSDPAEEAAAATAIDAGWSEVAGPSVKEEPEWF